VKRRALIAGGAALALVAAFVAGRLAAPTRIEERTKVETRTVYQIVRDEHSREERGPERIVTRWRTLPGQVVEVERTEERGPVVVTHDLQLNSSVVASEAREASRLVTTSRSGWRASVAADPLRLSLDARAFRFGLERRLMGPLWAGASYQHGGAVLVSVAGEW
jgi:hypothetical protein